MSKNVDSQSVTTVPAIRGRMGSTDYFQAVISASSLASIAVTASDLPAWETQSIFERIQRSVNRPRVIGEMVPYILETDDRFFGSLMLLVLENAGFEFDSLPPSLLAGQPAAIRESLADLGTITISHSCTIVALDGQHRLLTLKEVMSERYCEDPRALNIANDRLSVTFLTFESLIKTRRLFSKVNSHAKPTTPMDNIITSEDDGVAVVTRWMLEPQPPLGLPVSPISPWTQGPDLGIVEFKKAVCNQADTNLYSLKTIYEAIKTILAVNGTEDFDEKKRHVRPSDAELSAAYLLSSNWWKALTQTSSALRAATNNHAAVLQQKRSDAEQSLLTTQMGLLACIRAAGLIRDRGGFDDELLALKAVASISWRRSDELWRQILVNNGGQMINSQSNIRLAARLQAMRAASSCWSHAERLQLQAEIRAMKADPNWSLDLMH